MRDSEKLKVLLPKPDEVEKLNSECRSSRGALAGGRLRLPRAGPRTRNLRTSTSRGLARPSQSPPADPRHPAFRPPTPPAQAVVSGLVPELVPGSPRSRPAPYTAPARGHAP